MFNKLVKKSSSREVMQAQLQSTHAVLGSPSSYTDPDLKRTLSRYQELFSVTARLNADVTCGEALHELVTSVFSLINVQAASVYISQGWEFEDDMSPNKKRVMGLVMTSGESFVQDIKPEITKSISESVVGYVAYTKSSQIFEDIPNNANISKKDPLKAYKNALLVPIIIGIDSNVIGVLECVNKSNGNEKFSQADLVILQSIASSAGNALHKILLFNQALTAQRKSSALLELAYASKHVHEDTHIDFAKLVDRLLISVYKAMRTERALLFMCDSVKRELWCVKTSTDDPCVIPYGGGVIGMVANSGTTINIADCATDPRYDPRYDAPNDMTAHSILATPVRLSDDTVSAVLVVWNKRHEIFEFDRVVALSEGMSSQVHCNIYQFSKEDEFVLDSIAKQIGDIIERNALDSHYESVLHEISHLQAPDVDKILTASLLVETTNKWFYRGGRSSASPMLHLLATPSKRHLFRRVSELTYFFKAVGMFRRMLVRIRGYKSHLADVHGLDSACISGRACACSTTTRNPRRSVDYAKRQFRGESVGSELVRGGSSTLDINDPSLATVSVESVGFHEWCADVFSVDPTISPLMIFRAFESLGLVSSLQMAESSAMRFLASIRDSYLPREKCPYHNWDHALGVFQITYALLRKSKMFGGLLDHVKGLALLVAAVGHDAGHMGRNNDFEVKVGSKLALLYNDKSVLEQHHAATIFQLLTMPGHNMLQFVSRKQCAIFRKITIEAVLGTDMSFHVDLVKSLTVRMENIKGNNELGTLFDKDSMEDVIVVSKFVIHAIDIGGQCYPNKLSNIWGSRVINEFIAQTRDEITLGLEPAPYMLGLDNPAKAARMQYSFTANIVLPCWKIMYQMFPCCEPLMQNLHENIEIYKQEVDSYADQ